MHDDQRDAIAACPHDRPFEEIIVSWEFGRRGEMAYLLSGCPRCGGVRKKMVMHLNRGKSRSTKEMDALNAEDAAAVRAKLDAWRACLAAPAASRE